MKGGCLATTARVVLRLCFTKPLHAAKLTGLGRTGGKAPGVRPVRFMKSVRPVGIGFGAGDEHPVQWPRCHQRAAVSTRHCKSLPGSPCTLAGARAVDTSNAASCGDIARPTRR